MSNAPRKRAGLLLSGLTALCVAGGLAGATAVPAMAATPACTVSTVHSHSVTSKGTVSDRVTLTRRCGHAYQQWAHGWMHSYTGASDSWRSYKDARRYPCWSKEKWLHSVSAKGTVRDTVTITHGGC